ncbi:MAG: hypothetical protein ACFBSC_09125 [Microcoleaceae cyanobacterium]
MNDTEFLTTEEAMKVDAALLSSKGKFSARLAIYALRCLKQISQQESIPIESVTPEAVQTWIESDEMIRKQVELDSSFENFFTRLVLASLNPLRQTAESENSSIAALTVEQVVSWFEEQEKILN